MKEETENILIDSLQTVKVWVEKTGEFVAEQTPLVVQEILMYNFWYHLIWCLLGTLLFVVGAISLYKSIMYATRDYNDSSGYYIYYDNSGLIFLWFGCGVLSVVGIITMLHNLNIWLKILLAPRLYVIEYVTNLI